MQWIGRVLTTVVAMVVGLLLLTDVILTQLETDAFGLQPVFSQVGLLLLSWTAVILAFALFLGFYNLVKVHLNRIRTQQPGRIYSIILVVALFATLAFGWAGPTSANGEFIFEFILLPLEATLFALLAFFIATAAYRTFRVRNVESLFLVIFAAIVLLGQVPVGVYLWSELPTIKDWIIQVPALAGVRGILLGVALGTVATGLRLLMAADRPYIE